MDDPNLSTTVPRISTEIHAPADDVGPGTDLYDLHFEDFVTLRQVLGDRLGVECRGRYYCAPRSQFDRLRGDVREATTRRARVA